jgi:hypothetical protein
MSDVSWLIYICPCGGQLDWCDDATAAECLDCGTVHTSISVLVKVPAAEVPGE